MRLLIVEDEALAARRLARLSLDHLGPTACITHAPDLKTAVAELRAFPIDGILLDLNLAGEDGFDLLAETDGLPLVVVSAHSERSLEAFDHQVIDFIPKPVMPARLGRALDRLIAAHARKRSPTLLVRSAYRSEIVPCDQIVWACGADDYAELILVDGRRLLHDGGLSRLERLLPTEFVRTHRSAIVNAQHAVGTSSGEGGRVVTTVTGEHVPISRRRAVSVELKLSALRHVRG